MLFPTVHSMSRSEPAMSRPLAGSRFEMHFAHVCTWNGTWHLWKRFHTNAIFSESTLNGNSNGMLRCWKFGVWIVQDGKQNLKCRSPEKPPNVKMSSTTIHTKMAIAHFKLLYSIEIKYERYDYQLFFPKFGLDAPLAGWSWCCVFFGRRKPDCTLAYSFRETAYNPMDSAFNAKHNEL